MSYHADKLVIDARTDKHTDRQTQTTTIPEGQNWPRVKIKLNFKWIDFTSVKSYATFIGQTFFIMTLYEKEVICIADGVVTFMMFRCE